MQPLDDTEIARRLESVPGWERRGDRIGGIGVHIAARVMSLAQTGEVLASRTVRDLAAGSKLQFEDRGTHTLKGVSDPWQIFAVGGA